MLGGLTITFDMSLLVRFTKTPPSGAAAFRTSGSTADSPGETTTPAPSTMSADTAATETLAVAPVTFRAAVIAVIVAEPAVPAVTGTLTLVAPAAMVAPAATLATPGLLELKDTASPPAGAGDVRAKVRFCVPGPLIVTVAGG